MDETEDSKRVAAMEAAREWMEVAPPNEWFGHFTQLNNEYKMQLASISTKPKISKELGNTAFGLQIDNGWKPSESLKYAAIEHEEDVETILSVKNDKWRHCTTMVGFHSEFFNDNSMAVSPSELRAAVKSSSTINSGLTRVYKFQQHEKAIRELKERADTQEKQLKKLLLEQLSTSLDVEWIKDISGWQLEPKDKAKAMRDKGATNKNIAKVLGISERTVVRWLKEIV